MRPQHNKLITARTPLPKGACPPSADSGQVPETEEDKLPEALSSRGRTSFLKGTCPERNEGGQAHRGSLHDRKTKFKRGPHRPLSKFWLPE